MQAFVTYGDAVVFGETESVRVIDTPEEWLIFGRSNTFGCTQNSKAFCKKQWSYKIEDGVHKFELKYPDNYVPSTSPSRGFLNAGL